MFQFVPIAQTKAAIEAGEMAANLRKVTALEKIHRTEMASLVWNLDSQSSKLRKFYEL